MNEFSSRPNEKSRHRTILLATHGMKEADSAVKAAAQLAEATGQPIKAVAVLEPPPMVAGEYGFVIPVADVEENRRDGLLARVRKQFSDVLGADPAWPVELRSGDAPGTIAKVAESSDAAVIVMGLGHHNFMDRVFGSETTLHTVRAAHTPLFAVPQNFDQLPRHAVVGVDFSGTGMAAAQAALDVLPSLTNVTLVHVAPRWDLEPATYTSWRVEYERGIAPAFERVIRELDLPEGIRVKTAVREGKATQEILAAVEEQQADVIIVGSKGLGFLDRVLVGSTATGIIRSAPCSVFAFPVVAVGAYNERRMAGSAPRA